MFLLSYCLYPGLTLSEQDGLFWKVVGGKAQQEIEHQMSIIFILFLSNNNVFFFFLQTYQDRFANSSRKSKVNGTSSQTPTESVNIFEFLLFADTVTVIAFWNKMKEKLQIPVSRYFWWKHLWTWGKKKTTLISEQTLLPCAFIAYRQ